MNSAPLSQDRPAAARCLVSVVVKALNEEKNICAVLESCLAAVAEVGGEVILADSVSSDRTVELASRYPVRIVQLAHARERCCGIGGQLGYQHSFGEYIYLIDGDMCLLPGFLPRALGFLAQHPEAAGVGGHVVELNTDSLEYRERSLRAPAHLAPGEVDRLDGGGLYRRLAIQEAGYLCNRNLHSYEEFDLAARLRARSWKLWRIPAEAVTHRGHDTPPYELLRRRWHSGYACGLGELLRAAAGQPHRRAVWRGLRELRIYLAVLAWWCVLASLPWWPVSRQALWPLAAVTATVPLWLMAWRKRSFTRGLYSVVSWCFAAGGLVRGLLRRQRSPTERIASRILHEPPQARSPQSRQHYA